MSHELDIRADGTASMAYVGAHAWHGLGQELKPGATIEEWQAAAGMSHTLQRSIVRYATERGQGMSAWAELSDRHVIMRSDTKKGLSIVSDNYKIVQPKAVLEFFRDMAGKAGLTLETAGVLFEGRQYWALARVGEEAQVGQGDTLRSYLLLSSSCDGSMATEGRFTSVRVVCNNTLSLSRSRDRAKSKVSHRSVFSPDDMKEALGISGRDQFSDAMADFRRLADTDLAESEVVQMTVELFKPGAAKLAQDEYIKAVKSRVVTSVLDLALNGSAKGSALDGIKGTAWGWLNAVTEHVDHKARARSEDNRRSSAWFGPGDTIKSRALEMALAA